MTTETKVYAQLAANVYKVTDANVLEIPLGWESLEIIADQGDGFSAGVFRRIGTTEIVIAYTGTNANKLTDTQYANLPEGSTGSGLAFCLMQSKIAPCLDPYALSSPAGFTM